MKKKVPINSGEQELESQDDFEARDADFSQLEEEPQEAKATHSNHDVSELETQVGEYKEKYLRALADFENLKKRNLKERSDLLKYQGEKVFVDLVDIVDNLERALEHAEAQPESLREGVELIFKMFRSVLDKWDVRANSALGEQFDPNLQNAISKVPVDDEQPGTVINELKKAYFYKDKLIRAGEVVVASARETEAQAAGSDSDPSAQDDPGDKSADSSDS